ncbi:MAG: ATP-binding cassette domain-containing protein [Polynucleobacter sp.]|nr:ATP-binding cassette domain-containing protein [Polynucleobacter sp.]
MQSQATTRNDFGIELSDVTAQHPAASVNAPPAIQELSLAITPGEHVAIIGPSGAGKTSCLLVIAAALKVQSGNVVLNHQSVWKLPIRQLQKLRGNLFYAPQTPPLPPRQRVITALLAAKLPGQSFFASLMSLIYPRDIKEASEALAQFDLADKLWQRVDRLSGGERQRVGLARALLAPAKIWLIDEPLSALDPTRARQAIESLITHAKEHAVTLITSLHQVDVAISQFPRVIGLRDGKLAFDLPSNEVSKELLADLYRQHEHELDQSTPVTLDSLPEPAPVKIIHCR